MAPRGDGLCWQPGDEITSYPQCLDGLVRQSFQLVGSAIDPRSSASHHPGVTAGLPAYTASTSCRRRLSLPYTMAIGPMGCVTSKHPFLHTSTAYAHPRIRYTIHCFVHLTQICQTLENTTKALSGYFAAPSHLLLFSAVQISRLAPLAALAAVHHSPMQISRPSSPSPWIGPLS